MLSVPTSTRDAETGPTDLLLSYRTLCRSWQVEQAVATIKTYIDTLVLCSA